MVTIALDAMGGDNAPRAPVEAAGRVSRETNVRVLLVGRRDEVKRELEEQGIIVSAGQAKLLAEEAPFAYKDVSEVVETCEGAGLTRVVARLRPVGVVKG